VALLELCQLFREYTSLRLHLYDTLYQEGANPDATKLLVPALNVMIDITATRQNAFYMHLLPIVFILLFAFSCCSAFLAGYGTKSSGTSCLYLAFTGLRSPLPSRRPSTPLLKLTIRRRD